MSVSLRDCDVCGYEYHNMGTFPDVHENFPFDVVCTGCVKKYLQTGEWDLDTDKDSEGSS